MQLVFTDIGLIFIAIFSAMLIAEETGFGGGEPLDGPRTPVRPKGEKGDPPRGKSRESSFEKGKRPGRGFGLVGRECID